jgi:hypothetical protein
MVSLNFRKVDDITPISSIWAGRQLGIYFPVMLVLVERLDSTSMQSTAEMPRSNRRRMGHHNRFALCRVSKRKRSTGSGSLGLETW